MLEKQRYLEKRMFKQKYFLFLTMMVALISMALTSCEVGYKKEGYKNDGKEVTLHVWDEDYGDIVLIVDADPSTFEDLGDGYARDTNYVFLEGNILEGADAKTFKILEKKYAVDAYHVFHSYSIMTTADPKSFKVLSRNLTEDKKDFYWRREAIHVADKKSFVVLGDIEDDDTKWAKDKFNAYYMGETSVPLADYESFHPIGHYEHGVLSGAYAADKYRVYYKDHILEGADPESFIEVGFGVGQDMHRVYKGWKTTSIRDFKQLSWIDYYHTFYKDSLHVYTRELEILEDADPKTFKEFARNCCWYIDRNHVWYEDRLVKEADASSFQPLRAYFLDRACYFCKEKKVRGSFDSYYGKDNNYVFCEDSIIPGADPATIEKIFFEDVESWTVFDKNRIYQGKNSKELQKYLRDKYGKE